MMHKQARKNVDERDAVYSIICLDGTRFTLRRLNPQEDPGATYSRRLNAAHVAYTEVGLQRTTSWFIEAAQIFGLEVNLEKREVLYQPTHRDEYSHPHIIIGATDLKVVNRFTCLGSIIAPDAGIDSETGKDKHWFWQIPAALGWTRFQAGESSPG